MPPPGVFHLDGVALLLADQRARCRRGDRHLADLHVGLALADDLVDLLLFRILVDHRHGRAEHHGRARELGHVDHLGARELVLELGDAPLVMALRLLGGMVLGVFAEIAVGARLRDRLDDARALDLLAMLQLFLELGVPRRRHRDLVQLCHGRSLPVVLFGAALGCAKPAHRRKARSPSADGNRPSSSVASRAAALRSVMMPRRHVEGIASLMQGRRTRHAAPRGRSRSRTGARDRRSLPRRLPS